MPRTPQPKPKPKPTKKAQYQRLLETARELGVDDRRSGKEFERAFSKIVPPKRPVSDEEK